MFPVTGLFKTITCPDWNTCRLKPCLFNHSPPASLVGSSSSSNAVASTSKLIPPKAPASSTVPQKRVGEASAIVAKKVAKVESNGRTVVEGGVGAAAGAGGGGIVSSTSSNSRYQSFVQPVSRLLLSLCDANPPPFLLANPAGASTSIDSHRISSYGSSHETKNAGSTLRPVSTIPLPLPAPIAPADRALLTPGSQNGTLLSPPPL